MLSTLGDTLREVSLPELTKPNPPYKHRWGNRGFVAISAMLCAGASFSASGQSGSLGNIGPSGGEVAGAAIGIGAVIAVAIIVPVEISHSHHILTGCVMTSASGLELQTSDGKTYVLEGDAAGIKVGDKVKLHGSRNKKSKGSTGPGVFSVEKLNRDYGPCSVAGASSAMH